MTANVPTDAAVDAGLAAYDRGWKDCLTATIAIIDGLSRAEAVTVLTRLQNQPPPKADT